MPSARATRFPTCREAGRHFKRRRLAYQGRHRIIGLEGALALLPSSSRSATSCFQESCTWTGGAQPCFVETFASVPNSSLLNALHPSTEVTLINSVWWQLFSWPHGLKDKPDSRCMQSSAAECGRQQHHRNSVKMCNIWPRHVSLGWRRPERRCARQFRAISAEGVYRQRPINNPPLLECRPVLLDCPNFANGIAPRNDVSTDARDHLSRSSRKLCSNPARCAGASFRPAVPTEKRYSRYALHPHSAGSLR